MTTSDFVMPQTADYLWLGMGVVALIMGVFIVSYFIRARSLRRDMDLLDSLEQE